MLSSPSRGTIDGEASLLDHATQEKLRQRIDASYHKFIDQHHDGTYPEWRPQSKAHEDLSAILRDFRKLREGIVASGRTDAFAIAAYEDSVKLAIRARSHAEIGSALPYLVSFLHPAAVAFESAEIVKVKADIQRLNERIASSVDGITNGTASLKLGTDGKPLPTPQERLVDAEKRLELLKTKQEATTTNRCYFGSLLLLNAVNLPRREGDCPIGPDFYQIYRDLTCPVIRSVSLEGKPMPDRRPSVYDDLSFPPLPSDNPHLIFARKVHRAFVDSRWPTIRGILEAGTQGHITDSQILLVRGLVERLREAVWTRATLNSDKLTFVALVDRLLFDGWWDDGAEDMAGRDELERWLQSKGWDSPEIKNDVRVLLRNAPRDPKTGKLAVNAAPKA